MAMTDPIADYLTRIRNATRARHSKVDIPASNLLKSITEILLNEGYIRNFTVIDDNKQGILRIYLKYNDENQCAISGLKRISRPGLRQYTKADELPRVLNGLGIAIMTTSTGIITAKKARQRKIGGEVLCHVW
jgi:small subunit ribosomal protein S8